MRLPRLPRALRIVLFLAAVLHVIGLSWGLPSSTGWDNDGVAPREILPGLAATFTPGQFYTYPPLHLALLALLTLPVTLIAVFRAPTTALPDVIAEILQPPYMTAFSLTARVTSLVMSLGVAVALAKMTEEIAGRDDPSARRAGVFTAAVASVGMTFNYYAHMSNLDMPSLFWASLAALAFVRAAARQEPRRLRGAALLAACAVATKDQTYALFIVAIPILLAPWFAKTLSGVQGRRSALRARRGPWRESSRGQSPLEQEKLLLREIGIAVLLGAGVLLLVDGAITNPSGFARRVAFLRGPASQDFSNYERGVRGVVAIFVDVARGFDRSYPLAMAPFVLGGIVLALRATRRRTIALAPLLFGLSFTLAFNVAARRTDDRFVLPQMLFLSVYAGIGLERVWTLGRLGGRAIVVTLLLLSLWTSLRVDFMLLYEPRYATEAFLAANVGPDDTIEIHGLNVYLPRFPPARIVRVGPSDPKRRAPLPGVVEVEAPYSEIASRRPRFIVVSKCFVWRYLAEEAARDAGPGRMYPVGQQREAVDRDPNEFFQGLFAGRLGYHVAHEAPPFPGWFEPVEFHASLNCRATTFERD
ncbi:MAG: hypothetical protein KIT84_44500 [Labilithrix sp.]|nr:hypothetical protein [Labilithrix sp.]MCW5818141.1 hypothetical protein [Labilithrix sp.]